jgi:predicted NBD/HSP70 family sugar kinase
MFPVGNSRPCRATLKVPMIVAVDTGGTKTLVAVFDTAGQVVRDHRFPTPPLVEDYIAQLTTTIDELLAGQAITCLSVGLPGNIQNGVMVWAGNLAWHDTDMHALLSNHYDCPIIVENDANLAGLAETRALAETPPVCLYITVSTGIGTGLTIDGKIHPRLSRTEGGRMLLHHDGQPTIWESFASGKAIKARFNQLASEITDEATWRIVSDNIAQGLLAICPLLRPDVVVIGGGVGAHYDKFSQYLTATMQENLRDNYMPVIVEAVHPETAVLYGCYYHALDTHLN